MQDQPRSTNLSGLLEDARRRLVETGTRNRLIHVNRSAKRSGSIAADSTSRPRMRAVVLELIL